VLRGNFRLTRANLLKQGQLRKKSRRQVAVEQPEVNAGELVEKKASGEISHFPAGSVRSAGAASRVSAFAPMNAHKPRALDPAPSPFCVLPAIEKCEKEMGAGGAVRKAKLGGRHHPLRLRRNERRGAEKHAASGERPGFVRCLSGLAFDLGSTVVRAVQR
jgi:hypothetical protein